MPKYLKYIVDEVSARVSEVGFRRFGVILRKSIEMGKVEILFQSSVKSSADTLLFTANLTITDMIVSKWLMCHGYNDLKGFQFRERLGNYKCGTDYWWQWNVSESSIDVVEDVSTSIVSALSVEESNFSSGGLETSWECGRSPGVTSFMRQLFLIAYYEARSDLRKMLSLKENILEGDNSAMDRHNLTREINEAVARLQG